MAQIKSVIRFADEKSKAAFEEIKQSSSPNHFLYEHILRAFEEIEKDAFSGIHIPKRLIPKEYVTKYNTLNLWKCNLPKGWRLLYTVKSADANLVAAIIIEFMDHKNYEKRFKY